MGKLEVIEEYDLKIFERNYMIVQAVVPVVKRKV